MKDKRVQVWVVDASQVVDLAVLADLVTILREQLAEIFPVLVLDGEQGNGGLGAKFAESISGTISEPTRLIPLDEVISSWPDATMPRGDGGVMDVDVKRLRQLLDLGLIPILSPALALPLTGEDGVVHSLDIIAVATQVALALEAQKLILLGNLPGIKITGRIMRGLSSSQIAGLISDGYLDGQELAAAQSAVTAIHAGAHQVLITDLAGLAKDGGTAIVNG
jgi:hypothetical protein